MKKKTRTLTRLPSGSSVVKRAANPPAKQKHWLAKRMVDWEAGRKKCSRCKKILPLENFSPRKDRELGFCPHCKKCDFARKSDYRIMIAPLRREIERTEEFLKRRRKTHKIWRERNKDKIKKYNLNSRKRYPDRCAARCKSQNAIKRGRIKPPSRCSDCNKRTKLDGHHEDYSKPLDLTWLCKKCHSKRHRKFP